MIQFRAKKPKILILLISLLALSCAEENPNLVNPPPQYKSVSVRFINLAGDQLPRVLSLNNQVNSIETGFQQISNTFIPNADSSKLIILNQGQPEFTLQNKVHFIRNLTFTYICLPNSAADTMPNIGPVKNVINFFTTPTPPVSPYAVNLRFINTNPDTAYTYTMKIGCQNGDQAFPYTQFARVSSQSIDIYKGVSRFSLVRNGGGEIDKLIGIYETDTLIGRGEYTFIVSVQKDVKNSEKLFVLDEHNKTTAGFKELKKQEMAVSQVRLVNLSSSLISFKKDSNKFSSVINLGQNKVSGYSQLSACTSTSLDSISILQNDNNLVNVLRPSLELGNKYSIIVCDSLEGDSKYATILNPINLLESRAGKSIVRVLNLLPNYKGLNVSLGARQNLLDSNRYEAGKNICSELKFYNISNPAIINPGKQCPITLISSEHPVQYIYSTNYSFNADSNYLIIVSQDFTNNKIRVNIVNDNSENTSFNNLEEGVLLQLVDAIPGLEKINFRIDNVIDQADAVLYYTSSIATVIPQGTNNITMNGKTYSVNATLGTRIMLVASGDMLETEILDFTNAPMGANGSNYERRFINASKQIPEFAIYLKTTDVTPILPAIAYKSSSINQTVSDENRLNFIFRKPTDSTSIIAQANDIRVNYGKNYSFIFIGDSIKTINGQKVGFSVVVQQDF